MSSKKRRASYNPPNQLENEDLLSSLEPSQNKKRKRTEYEDEYEVTKRTPKKQKTRRETTPSPIRLKTNTPSSLGKRKRTDISLLDSDEEPNKKRGDLLEEKGAKRVKTIEQQLVESEDQDTSKEIDTLINDDELLNQGTMRNKNVTINLKDGSDLLSVLQFNDKGWLIPNKANAKIIYPVLNTNDPTGILKAKILANVEPSDVFNVSSTVRYNDIKIINTSPIVDWKNKKYHFEGSSNKLLINNPGKKSVLYLKDLPIFEKIKKIAQITGVSNVKGYMKDWFDVFNSLLFNGNNNLHRAQPIVYDTRGIDFNFYTVASQYYNLSKKMKRFSINQEAANTPLERTKNYDVRMTKSWLFLTVNTNKSVKSFMESTKKTEDVRFNYTDEENFRKTFKNLLDSLFSLIIYKNTPTGKGTLAFGGNTEIGYEMGDERPNMNHNNVIQYNVVKSSTELGSRFNSGRLHYHAALSLTYIKIPDNWIYTNWGFIVNFIREQLLIDDIYINIKALPSFSGKLEDYIDKEQIGNSISDIDIEF